jgi:hypothetical protein
LQVNDASPDRDVDGRAPVGHVQFGQDVLDVISRRFDADSQTIVVR